MMRMSWIKRGIFGATVALSAGLGFGQADVIVGDVAGVGSQPGGNGPQHFGTTGDLVAYSIGTTSCNIGTVALNWFQSGADRHPLILTNIYRINHGAIEQIGVSWIKHGFCALQQTLCGSCSPTCGGCCSTLGVGCSDPYSTGLNGSQSGLGPRFEINPATGQYPWPFTTAGATGNQIYKRIQVHVDDLNPALNAGAVYVSEAQYIARDDALAGNDLNNASYRMTQVGPENAFSGGWYLNYTAATVRQKTAIEAWQVNVPSVELATIDVPNDGRFWVGANVIDNGDGTWRYEYAVFNMNSDRAAGSFSVETDAPVTNIGFKDIDYHSGEPWNNTDWTGADAGSEIVWSNGTTFGTNPVANAIRYGTLYNFRFTSTAAPVDGTVTIGLFEPSAGNPDEMSVTLPVPGAAQGGCNDADIAEPFDVLDLGDIQAFIAAFTGQDPLADIAAPFGVFDLADIQAFIAAFNAGCP
jgi:hypothetical protein